VGRHGDVTVTAEALDIVATGLRFPEGPVMMPDGSVIVVEIAGGGLSRVRPDGSVEEVARCGGGPNGAALGPDGMLYVCNNGGQPFLAAGDKLLLADVTQDDGYEGGSIQRVDPADGSVEVLYRQCAGRPLRSPNDLVFDDHGGFWFTDTGKARARDRDWGGVYYALADGSAIREVIFPLDFPNGIGFSGDGEHLLVTETVAGRLWSWPVTGRGMVSARGRRLIAGLQGYQLLDSLAVDAEGNVCIGTLVTGGITVVTPAGDLTFLPLPDPLVTNLCFGGEDRSTAYVTLSATGRLARVPWPPHGLRRSS